MGRVEWGRDATFYVKKGDVKKTENTRVSLNSEPRDRLHVAKNSHPQRQTTKLDAFTTRLSNPREMREDDQKVNGKVKPKAVLFIIAKNWKSFDFHQQEIG